MGALSSVACVLVLLSRCSLSSASPLAICNLPSVETDGALNEGQAQLIWAEKLFDHARRAEPVILRNLTSGWAASSLWNPAEAFVRRFPELKILVHDLNPTQGLSVFDRRATAADYLRNTGENETFNRDMLLFGFNDPEVYQAISPDVKPFPKPLLSFREEPGFSFGKPGSGAGLHFHKQAWHAQVVGRKHFMLAPALKEGRKLGSGAQKASGCDLLNGRIGKEHLPLPKKLCSLELLEGDVLYFPHGWIHATCNSADAPSIAVVGQGSSPDWPTHFHSVLDGDVAALQAEQLGRRELSVSLPPSGETAVHLAARSSTAALQLLLAKRADPNVPDQKGYPPLHTAAANGHAQNCEVLISAGVSPDAETAEGVTPFQSAVQAGHVSIAEYLQNKGAAIEAEGSIGSRALHGAAQKGHHGLISWLLRQRANPDAATSQGRTPLHFLAEGGFPGAVRELCSARANLDARDELGLAPMHIAATSGHDEVLASLVDAGSDAAATVTGWWPSAPTGLTLLHLSALQGHVEVVRMLVERLKIDTETVDSSGRRALDLADWRQQKKVAKYLRKVGVKTHEREDL